MRTFANPWRRPSLFVRSSEGEDLGKRLYNELNEELERIQPGILKNI